MYLNRISFVIYALLVSLGCRSQANFSSRYIKVLASAKEMHAGGAAGNASSIIYLVTCKIIQPAEVSNVKARINDTDLRVVIVYKNAEHSNVKFAKGDSFLFRVTQITGAVRRQRGSISPEEPIITKKYPASGNDILTLSYSLNNKKNELLQIREFTQSGPRIHQ